MRQTRLQLQNRHSITHYRIYSSSTVRPQASLYHQPLRDLEEATQFLVLPRQVGQHLASRRGSARLPLVGHQPLVLVLPRDLLSGSRHLASHLLGKPLLGPQHSGSPHKLRLRSVSLYQPPQLLGNHSQRRRRFSDSLARIPPPLVNQCKLRRPLDSQHKLHRHLGSQRKRQPLDSRPKLHLRLDSQHKPRRPLGSLLKLHLRLDNQFKLPPRLEHPLPLHLYLVLLLPPYLRSALPLPPHLRLVIPLLPHLRLVTLLLPHLRLVTLLLPHLCLVLPPQQRTQPSAIPRPLLQHSGSLHLDRRLNPNLLS